MVWSPRLTTHSFEVTTSSHLALPCIAVQIEIIGLLGTRSHGTGRMLLFLRAIRLETNLQVMHIYYVDFGTRLELEDEINSVRKAKSDTLLFLILRADLDSNMLTINTR
jgi:hypothetical protein